MFHKLALLGFLLVAVAPVRAQTAPGSNIDDRFRLQTLPRPEAERSEAIMTGDADIVLLRRTRLFTLHGSATANYSSNAALSPTTRNADAFFQIEAGVRVGTRLGGRVDVFADLGAVGVRYAKYAALDYSALTGLVGAATQLGPFEASAAYQPSIVYERNFNQRQLTQHRFRFNGSLPVTWRKLSIAPSLGIERVLSTPRDYRNTALSADLSLSTPIGQRVIAFASLGYEQRRYDSYFPDLVGVKRRDRRFDASLGVVYRPARWATLRASYSFSHNVSTSDVNGYVAHMGAIGVSAELRF